MTDFSRPSNVRRVADLGASRTTLGRWLHLGMATCISLCLLLSLCFVLPVGSHISGALVAFNLHKFIGLNGLFILLLYLLWGAQGHTKKWGDLFPWSSSARLRCIARELGDPAEWMHMKAVPAMVQGLGITLAALAFLSGLWLVLAVISGVFADPAALAMARFVHLWSSRFLWAYLTVHVGAVVLHAVSGHTGEIKAMFRLLDPNPLDSHSIHTAQPSRLRRALQDKLRRQPQWSPSVWQVTQSEGH